jgi:hypothetical protein
LGSRIADAEFDFHSGGGGVGVFGVVGAESFEDGREVRLGVCCGSVRIYGRSKRMNGIYWRLRQRKQRWTRWPRR